MLQLKWHGRVPRGRLCLAQAGLVALFASASCESDDDGTGGGGGTGAGGGGAPPAWQGEVKFEPCPDDDPAPGAECASIQVPANWDDPEGESITFVVRRIVRAESRGQLWLLSGGPGQPGYSFLGSEDLFAQLAPGFDLYMPDHRGTGDSTYLYCPSVYAPGGVEDCVERIETTWGDAAPYFSITQAARDVGEVIAEVRKPNEPVLVLGISYGTTWGHRYLQVFPDQANGIVLDSPCPPGTCDFSVSLAAAGNDVARSLFEQCADDVVCASKLGSDPWARFSALLDALDAGHCPGSFLNRKALAGQVGSMLKAPWLRGYIPALVYRLERCDPADLVALSHLFTTPYEHQTEFMAMALRFHIVLSELFPEPAPTVAEVRAGLDALLLGTEDPLFFAQARPFWPVYPRDEYVGTYATTDTPLLILSGTLDPVTPPAIAAPFGEHYQGEHQHYVPVERATHNVVGDACGQELIHSFFADPLAPLDTSCAANTPLVDFDGTAEANEHFLGTPDAFENP
jgi:pimeloyl-ACP methyl ester carboxylesterase